MVLFELNIVTNRVQNLNSFQFHAVASNFLIKSNITLEQHALKNVNNCLNTKIYSFLEKFCGQSSNLYLNAVHFFNTSVN